MKNYNIAAKEEGRHPLPAQDRPGRRRPELRHRGGQAGRVPEPVLRRPGRSWRSWRRRTRAPPRPPYSRRSRSPCWTWGGWRPPACGMWT
ncbi:MAG: hypothetical protein ACLRIS_04285 [Flavonifractor plautii]